MVVLLVITTYKAPSNNFTDGGVLRAAVVRYYRPTYLYRKVALFFFVLKKRVSQRNHGYRLLKIICPTTGVAFAVLKIK